MPAALLSPTRLPGRPSLLRCLGAALLVLTSPAGLAGDAPTDAGAVLERLRLSGFGTAGWSWSSARDADYVGTQQPDGPGRTGETSGSLDSNFGLQLDARLGDTVSASLQVLSEYRPEGDWTPQLSVASLRWTPAPALAIRAGRFQSSTFLATDYRYVRFANIWLRPPREVYGVQPTNRLDGADLSWQRPLGEGRLLLRGGAGEVVSGAVATESGKSDEIRYRGAFLRAEWEGGPWLVSGSVTHNRVSFAPSGPVGRALDSLAALDPEAAAAAVVDERPNTALALGVAYDSPTWVLQAEWARAWNKSILIDRSGAYALAGHRFGRLLPYLMAAERWTHGQKIHSAVPAAEALLRLLYANQHSDQRSLTLGLNIELRERLMLKLGHEWIAPTAGGTGLQGNIWRDYSRTAPSPRRLLSINLDGVF